MMEIRWLKTFIVCAKFENFRQASEELFLTQPAITKHIKRLEEHLNVQLFERRGKAVYLTSAGHTFLSYAKDFLATYEQGIDRFESWKQGYHRKLTIATAPQIASSFLPRLLREFINSYPDIEVIVDVVNSYEVGEAISGSKADLGLSRMTPVQTNVKSEAIHEEPVILVGPNEWAGSLRNEQHALSHYRLITHNHPDYWDSLLNEVKKHYPRIRTMTVNQVEVTKKFIENNLGVSYLPFSMVKDDLKKNILSEIVSDQISPPVSVTYLVTKVETNEVRSFTEFIKNYQGFI